MTSLQSPVAPPAGTTGSRIDAIANVAVITLPPLLVLYAAWRAWGCLLRWSDLAVMYPLTGLGITVGFHRLFTHRAFATNRPLALCWPHQARRPSKDR
jgi:stearoyl-CoA desaturase (delta-9 desaturase)